MKMKWSMNMGSSQDSIFAKSINRFRGMGINAMVLALVGISLFVMLSMAGFGLYGVYQQGIFVENTVDIAE